MTLTSEPCDLTLSTAMELAKQCLLKLAVTPPVPANNSKMTVSAAVNSSSGSSQSVPVLGISYFQMERLLLFLLKRRVRLISQFLKK